MKYQLVIQFSETLEGGFDRLIEIEDLLYVKLESGAEIDGHDIGSGQMNIFIMTNNPEKTFNEIKTILKSSINVLSKMKAAYRNIEQNNFVCLHPIGLTEFNVI